MARNKDRYTFIPNQMAIEAFNLARTSYTGKGMTPVLQKALGADNYDNHIIPTDPLCGGKLAGEIRIIVNHNERDPEKMEYATIGTMVYKFA